MIRINEYEIMLMIEPDVAEERHQEIIERVKTTVTQAGGTWNGVDAWGKRKLAYEIDHHPDAWYFVLSFDAPAEALAESTRVLAITDGVMRHMAVNRPKAGTGRAAEPHPEPAQARAER